MTQLTELRAANDLSDVAHLLNLKPGMLSYVLYIEAKGALYKKFDIPKKNGGTREINAPEKSLKLIQYRLSQLLQNCASEISVGHGHLENEDHPGISHGFKRKHTIMTNARVHVTRRYVFNVDLHDFFGSINFGRVRGFLLKDKNFLLKPAVATVLAQIACHDNQLPQGSPCSPVISNLIGHTLDILLVDMARKYGCTYTRYADDLSFSSNKREFPEQIAKRESEAHAWVVGKTLNRLVTKSGFDFNHTKTRMQYRDSRQEVTGLTVNRKVNSTRTYRHTVRAMVDTLLKTGTFDFIFQTKDEKGTPVVTKTPGSNSQLLGMLSFIDQVDLFDQKLCEKNHTSPANTFGRIKLFRRFLYFDAFYAAPMPVIVCEGKTDNIYIKCAIRSLAPLYPMLASAGPPPKLAVRLFKYSERRISSVTELGEGGVGGLCKLIKHYHDDVTAKFKAPAPKYPVIVLIDNDKGANAVYGAFVGATKTKKPTGTEPFIHVISNLYIVATPLAAGKTESTIEDFFDPALLKTVLNGKTFNPSNNDKEKDNTKYYGKAAFARDVVAKNAATVNFSGFKDILDRLVAVMDDYAKILAITTKP